MLWKIPSVFFAITAAAAVAQDAAPLRFHLEVGQELSFLGMSEFRHDRGTEHITDRLTLWVTKLNADGSWHVIARSENSLDDFVAGETGEHQPGERATQFDAFDVFPNGRLAHLPADARAAAALTGYFFPLPDDAGTTRDGWKTTDEKSGETLTYRALPPGDEAESDWIIDRASKGLMNDIYASTSHARLQFDSARGLLVRAEAEFTQGWGSRGWGSSFAELKSVANRDPEWLAKFSREAEIFLKANAAMRETVNGLQPSLDTTGRALREMRGRVSIPLIQAEFDRALAEFPAAAAQSAAAARSRAAAIGKPAPDWDAADLSGVNYKLVEFRGKVLVLAFWSRKNRWSVGTLPQLKEIVRSTAGEPVSILGMNTDADESDARFVEKKIIFNFPTLAASGIAAKYPSPAVVVIDQRGDIRALHTSSGPRLRDDILKSIDALLAPPIAKGPRR